MQIIEGGQAAFEEYFGSVDKGLVLYFSSATVFHLPKQVPAKL